MVEWVMTCNMDQDELIADMLKHYERYLSLLDDDVGQNWWHTSKQNWLNNKTKVQLKIL